MGHWVQENAPYNILKSSYNKRIYLGRLEDLGIDSILVMSEIPGFVGVTEFPRIQTWSYPHNSKEWAKNTTLPPYMSKRSSYIHPGSPDPTPNALLAQQMVSLRTQIVPLAGEIVSLAQTKGRQENFVLMIRIGLFIVGFMLTVCLSVCLSVCPLWAIY